MCLKYILEYRFFYKLRLNIIVMADIDVVKEGAFGDRSSWDEYFMHMAIGVSSRASCYKVHAGSVLVKDKLLVGTGYNGAPSGVESCLEKGGCYKEAESGKSYADSMNIGLCRGVHGEMNAKDHLVQAVDRGELTLYTTIFPCNGCAKNISGIKRVVFKSGYDGREFDAALGLFLERGTKVDRLDMSPERYMDIAFNRSNVVHSAWSPEDVEKIEKMMGAWEGLGK